MSALVRQAVAQTYGTGTDPESDLEATDAAFGTRGNRDVDGAIDVDQLRSGDRPRRATGR